MVEEELAFEEELASAEELAFERDTFGAFLIILYDLQVFQFYKLGK
jgi:hypothetical protein